MFFNSEKRHIFNWDPHLRPAESAQSSNHFSAESCDIRLTTDLFIALYLQLISFITA